jgi:hypothetical protein
MYKQQVKNLSYESLAAVVRSVAWGRYNRIEGTRDGMVPHETVQLPDEVNVE